jgi:hypothetical protein
VEHANTDYPRRKRFSKPIAKAKKLCRTTAWNKSRFYISKKTSSETTKCPSLAKKSSSNG